MYGKPRHSVPDKNGADTFTIMASRHGNPRAVHASTDAREASRQPFPKHSRNIRHVQLAAPSASSKSPSVSDGEGHPDRAASSGSPRVSRRGPAHSRDLKATQRRSSIHKRSSAEVPAAGSSAAATDAEYERLKRGRDASATSHASTGSAMDAQVRAASRKKRRRKKVLVGALVSLVCVCLIGAGAAFAYIYSINKNLQNRVDDALLSVLSPVDTPTDPFYVLLLGTDGSAEREAEDGLDEGSYRSDSLMLARVDPKAKKAAIISIPRDLLVDIPGNGQQKINAALALGGPSLAVKTVSTLAGVPITHYAEVNFDGFSAMVDTLGGIEVDVPITIDDPEAGGHLDAGVQTLDGNGALILCRSRHSYDDYGAGDIYRAANQRMVLSAIAQKMLSADPLSLGGSVSTLSQFVTTDLDVAAIVGIAQTMRGIDAAEDIYTAVAPTTSEYKNGGWYEILDKTAWKEMIKRLDEGLPPVSSSEVDLSTGTVLASAGGKSEGSTYKVNKSTSIRVRNGSGVDGVCDLAMKKLQAMGYERINTGNADSFDYQDTIIIYKKDNQLSEVEAIARELGGTVVKDDGTYLFESNFLIVIGSDWNSSTN